MNEPTYSAGRDSSPFTSARVVSDTGAVGRHVPIGQLAEGSQRHIAWMPGKHIRSMREKEKWDHDGSELA